MGQHNVLGAKEGSQPGFVKRKTASGEEAETEDPRMRKVESCIFRNVSYLVGSGVSNFAKWISQGGTGAKFRTIVRSGSPRVKGLMMSDTHTKDFLKKKGDARPRVFLVEIKITGFHAMWRGLQVALYSQLDGVCCTAHRQTL